MFAICIPTSLILARRTGFFVWAITVSIAGCLLVLEIPTTLILND